LAWQELRVVYPAVAHALQQSVFSVTLERVHKFLDIPSSFVTEVNKMFA
jgi:hypothetical protein